MCGVVVFVDIVSGIVTTFWPMHDNEWMLANKLLWSRRLWFQGKAAKTVEPHADVDIIQLFTTCKLFCCSTDKFILCYGGAKRLSAAINTQASTGYKEYSMRWFLKLEIWWTEGLLSFICDPPHTLDNMFCLNPTENSYQRIKSEQWQQSCSFVSDLGVRISEPFSLQIQLGSV